MKTIVFGLKLLLASAASVLILGGCKQGSDLKPVSVDPAVAKETASWVTLKAKGGVVTIKVPQGWVPMDPQDPLYSNLVKEFGNSNPQIAKLRTTASRALLLGFHFKPGMKETDFVDNVNINRVASNNQKEITDKDVAEAKAGIEKTLPMEGDLKIEKLSVPAGQAMRYATRVKFNAPGGKPFITSLIGYMVPHGDWIYIVTFATAPERAQEMETLAAKSIQTLAF